MNDDELIRRFGPVLQAGLPAAGPDQPVTVHAEVLHQLYLADGLLEVLQWSAEGTGADPLACMWLASLRWYRLLRAQVPSGAPVPPDRPLDRGLGLLVDSRALHIVPGTGSQSLAGLASGEMAYPSAPAQPAADDDAALLRAVPLGLVPYVDDQTRLRWVEQAMALTHGDPDLTRLAQRLAVAVSRSGAQDDAALGHPGEDPEDLLAGVSAPVRTILHTQLQAARAAPSHQQQAEESLLGVVVDDLSRRWAAAVSG